MQAENKLQEITQKLYEEGLSKGKLEGERILSEAKQEAERCKEMVQAEMEKLRKDTELQIAREKEKAEAELKRGLRQMVSEIKSEIEECLLSKTIESSVNMAFNQVDFVKKLLIEAVKSFGNSENDKSNIEILVPEPLLDEYNKILKAEMSDLLKNGMEVRSKKNLKVGFEIRSKEKGYKLSFTEDDFSALLKQYAGDSLRKWIF